MASLYMSKMYFDCFPTLSPLMTSLPFPIVNVWSQLRHLPTDKLVNKGCHIYIMELCLVIKKSKIMQLSTEIDGTGEYHPL